jgi:hypothetical protein
MNTIRILKLRIGIRKMLSDIALPGRAQKRIAQSVQKNIRIGMPVQTFRVRDLYTPQNELPALLKTMYIIA